MRFSFGANWRDFSTQALDSARVGKAREAFESLTDGIDFTGKRFLDVGYGQGLALFLAMERGARVYGIDSDPLCEQALALTHRHFPGFPLPPVAAASILDRDFVDAASSDGGYDIVHSWGALHHTGDMQSAIDNVAGTVKPGGTLILAIYNRHWTSPLWKGVKIIYNQVPPPVQKMMVALCYSLRHLRRPTTFRRSAPPGRGMSSAFDLQDWLGGYPYEYAGREEITARFTRRGFKPLRTISSTGWTGCNQFVFRRS